MATQFDPIAKDQSINTTESPSRNIADVLAQELANLSTAVKPNASNILMSDNVTTVEDAITELQDNTFSTPVDISGYTSGNNPYTTPSDGYLSIYVNADNTHTTVAVAGKGKTNTQYFRVRHSGANSAEYGMLYVKKGMLLWIDQSTDTGASKYIQFVPLT